MSETGLNRLSKKVNPQFLLHWMNPGTGTNIKTEPDRTQTISATGGGGGGRGDSTKIIISVTEPSPGDLLVKDCWFKVLQ